MRTPTPEQGQAAQRVKVGLVGLATVLLLIGLASIIFSFVRQDRPVSAAGGASADVIANIADGNVADADGQNEPLADLGVAPSAPAPDTAPAAPASPTPPAAP